MAFVTKSASMTALIALMILVPTLAQAQEQRFRISFTPAMATISDDAELALAGSFGYRFSEHFWFEGEFTWIDAAAGGFPDTIFESDGRSVGMDAVRALLTGRSVRFGRGGFGAGFLNLPPLTNLPEIGQWRASLDGETMIGTLGLRYELPVQTERFRPYLSGGLGINNSEQDLDIERLAAGDDLDDSISHTGYAFSAGAGASVRLFSSLWADVDAKYFRLSRERNVMRLGGGVSFRF